MPAQLHLIFYSKTFKLVAEWNNSSPNRISYLYRITSSFKLVQKSRYLLVTAKWMLYWPLFNQQLKSEFTLRKLWIDFLLGKTLEPSEALQEPMFDCLGIDEISNPLKQILAQSILSNATLMLNLDKTHTAFDIWNLSISVDNCYENKNHLPLHNGKQWTDKARLYLIR